MNVRKVRIKKKLISESEDSFLIYSSRPEKQLAIPKRLVIKSNSEKFYSKNNMTSTWDVFHIDNDFFKNQHVMKKIFSFKNSGHLFLYGYKKFYVNFDSVITKLYSRPMTFCFYCDDELISSTKTTEHILPRNFIQAYGYNSLDDNTVPCCRNCNSLKSNLHPVTFRELVKTMISNTTDELLIKKLSSILKTLNKILIDKKDIFDGGKN